jgi:catechol 2,3-dioxygenase-like lactoylglutathione lyase family enzyme
LVLEGAIVTTARVGYSVPILRVKDVERSVRFYELLGFTATALLRTKDGVAYWANLSCHRGPTFEEQSSAGDKSVEVSKQNAPRAPDERTTENESAAVMVSLGEDPLAPLDGTMQAASLYLFTKDLEGLRAQLVSQGVEVSEIVTREYMPKGEMELRDPDGWRVFVGGA